MVLLLLFSVLVFLLNDWVLVDFGCGFVLGMLVVFECFLLELLNWVGVEVGIF